jgi:hypothetical protein
MSSDGTKSDNQADRIGFMVSSRGIHRVRLEVASILIYHSAPELPILLGHDAFGRNEQQDRSLLLPEPKSCSLAAQQRRDTTGRSSEKYLTNQGVGWKRDSNSCLSSWSTATIMSRQALVQRIGGKQYQDDVNAGDLHHGH